MPAKSKVWSSYAIQGNQCGKTIKHKQKQCFRSTQNVNHLDKNTSKCFTHKYNVCERILDA